MPTASAPTSPFAPAATSPSRQRTSRADRRYAMLDVLRCVAALLVAVMHWGLELGQPAYSRLYDIPVLGYVISHGTLGVQAFFMISGLVIMDSATRAPDWWRFLVARFTRLFPGLFVSMVIVLGIGTYFIGSFPTPGLSFIHSVLLTYPLADVEPLATPLWTLVIELQFYATIAALLWGLPAVFRSRLGVVALLVVWQGVIAALTLVHAPPFVNVIAGFLSLQSYAGFFFLGVCMHLLAGLDRGSGLVSVPVVLVAMGTAFNVFFVRLELAELGEVLIVACFAALIMASTMIRVADGVGSVARVLGLASYPIYLLHEHLGTAFLVFFRRHATSDVPVAVVASIVFITVVCSGIALVVELPAQRWLRQRLLVRATRRVEAMPA